MANVALPKLHNQSMNRGQSKEQIDMRNITRKTFVFLNSMLLLQVVSIKTW